MPITPDGNIVPIHQPDPDAKPHITRVVLEVTYRSKTPQGVHDTIIGGVKGVATTMDEYFTFYGVPAIVHVATAKNPQPLPEPDPTGGGSRSGGEAEGGSVS